MTVVLTTGFAAIVTTDVARGALVRELVWTDPFNGADQAPLADPWMMSPANAYRTAGPSNGVAYAPLNQGWAWRETNAVDQEIEVTGYKLTDGGSGNSIGGVTVGQVDASNFVGYELVKTTSGVPKAPEAKSVLYVKIAGMETVLSEPLHSELAIDQVVNLRLRKVGPVIEAYLNGVLDISHTLDQAMQDALSGTNVGLVNFTGPNNYDEARAFKIVDQPDPPPPVEETTPAPSPTAPVPTTSPTSSAPTSTPKPTPTTTKRTFTDRPGDVSVGADLRRLSLAPGNRIILTTTLRGLRRSVGVGITFYVDTSASNAGPEYRVSTVPGGGAAVSVRRVPGWKAAGRTVVCSSTRTVDYTAETVKVSLAPSCLGGSSRLRVAARVTQAGVTDWAPSRQAFYAWVPR